MKVQIVVGANFGDEGKGAVVDYLVSRRRGDACVVRHNGGAQAGHTVVTPEGVRHVHSHFGCGTLQGADTVLSRFFVCNPMVFRSEYEQLSTIGITPRVLVDPRCPVTTPFDVMVNQIVEASRGDRRYGSVGVGFGETIERHGDGSDRYSLSVRDLFRKKDWIKQRLVDIRDDWVPIRLHRLGGLDPAVAPQRWLGELIERYMEDLEFFLHHTTVMHDYLARYDTIIFEGAQGLALDQYRGTFPYVTRSNTGVLNALRILNDVAIDEVYYVTRPYLTRHGRGPLPREGELIGINIIDQTNTTKRFQEHLRLAPIYFGDALDALSDRISADRRDLYAYGADIETRLAVTCLDQIDRLSASALVSDMGTYVGTLVALLGYGPTRETMRVP